MILLINPKRKKESMKNIYLAIIMCAIAMLASCSDDDSNNDDGLDKTKIYHTAVGAEWLFNTISYIEDGFIDTTELKEEIIGTKVLNGETLYSLRTDEEDNVIYIINRVNGLYVQLDSNDNLELFRKFPCTVGERFIDSKNNNIEVISTNKQITVAGKIYNTVLYRDSSFSNGNIKIEDTYMEPGLGLVKWDVYEIDSADNRRQIRIKELKSFKKGM